MIRFIAGEHIEGTDHDRVRYGHNGAFLFPGARASRIIQGRQVGPLGQRGGRRRIASDRSAGPGGLSSGSSPSAACPRFRRCQERRRSTPPGARQCQTGPIRRGTGANRHTVIHCSAGASADRGRVGVGSRCARARRDGARASCTGGHASRDGLHACRTIIVVVCAPDATVIDAVVMRLVVDDIDTQV